VNIIKLLAPNKCLEFGVTRVPRVPKINKKGPGRFFSFHPLGPGQKRRKISFNPICQSIFGKRLIDSFIYNDDK
jgi:hypothetical protein